MRDEGGAMLRAAVHDLQLLHRTKITVPLGIDVTPPSLPADNVRIVRVESNGSLLDQLQRQFKSADLILIIAPETDGILTDLVERAHESVSAECRILNLGGKECALFCDKLRTSAWLTDRDLPAPETFGVSENDATLLLAPQTDVSAVRQPIPVEWILKPRDGVGCEAVSVFTHPSEPAPSMKCELKCRDVCVKELPWVAQRRLVGDAYSVGVIGHGPDQTSILPVTRQQIHARNQRLFYVGGSIGVPRLVAESMTDLAHRFARHLPDWRGYLGIDAICDTSTGQVLGIVEINPRLCTSFVGYRHLADAQSAGSLLTQPVSLLPTAIQFDLKGNVN